MSEEPVFRFPPEIQRRILGLLLVDPDLDLHVLDSRYFPDPTHELLSEAVIQYRRQYSAIPDTEALAYVIRAGMAPQDPSTPFPDELYTFCMEEVQSILEYPYEDMAFYREEAVKFAKEQRLRLAVREFDKHMVDGTHSEFAQEVQDAVSIQSSTMYREVSIRDVPTWKGREIQSRQNKVPTGFPTLDEYIGGGISPGEVISIAAPPKGGKTRFLLALAINEMMAGYTVQFASAELQDFALSERIANAVIGPDYDNIRDDQVTIATSLGLVLGDSTGDIRIHQFPQMVSTLEEVRATFEKQAEQERFSPRILLIDYVDKLRPSKITDKRHADLERQYNQLCDWAKSAHVAIVTAGQTTREAVDRADITLRHLGDAFAKGAVADGVWALVPDRENPHNRFRVVIVASRSSSDHRNIPFAIDPATQRIAEL